MNLRFWVFTCIVPICFAAEAQAAVWPYPSSDKLILQDFGPNHTTQDFSFKSDIDLGSAETNVVRAVSGGTIFFKDADTIFIELASGAKEGYDGFTPTTSKGVGQPVSSGEPLGNAPSINGTARFRFSLTPLSHPLFVLPYSDSRSPVISGAFRNTDSQLVTVKNNDKFCPKPGEFIRAAIDSSVDKDLNSVRLQVGKLDNPSFSNQDSFVEYFGPLGSLNVISSRVDPRGLGDDHFIYATWNMSASPDGPYRVTATAKDAKSNSTSNFVDFIKDCKPLLLAVLDANSQEVPNGGFPSQGEISISADDGSDGSGPGRIEIYQGDPNAGGSLLASNDNDFGESHTYSSSDQGLSILANLPEDLIFVRVIDQAGNESSVSFEIRQLISKDPRVGAATGGFYGNRAVYASPGVMKGNLLARSRQGFSSYKLVNTDDQTIVFSLKILPVTLVKKNNLALPKGAYDILMTEVGGFESKISFSVGDKFIPPVIYEGGGVPTQLVMKSDIRATNEPGEVFLGARITKLDLGINADLTKLNEKCIKDKGVFTPAIAASFQKITVKIKMADTVAGVEGASAQLLRVFEPLPVFGDKLIASPLRTLTISRDVDIEGRGPFYQITRTVELDGEEHRLGTCDILQEDGTTISKDIKKINILKYLPIGVDLPEIDPVALSGVGEGLAKTLFDLTPKGSISEFENGVKLNFALVDDSGLSFVLERPDIPIPPTHTNLSGGLTYEILTEANFTGNVTLSIPIKTSGYTAAELNDARIFHCTAANDKCIGLQMAILNGRAETTVSELGSFSVLLPKTTALPPPNDNSPPFTAIVLAGPKFTTPQGDIFLSEESNVGFSAVDFGGLAPDAVGVERTFFLDAEVFIDLETTPAFTFGGGFGLVEGIHNINYFSVDKIGNTETPHNTQILNVDATMPETTYTLSGPQVLGVNGSSVIAPSSQFVLTSTDPVFKNVSS
ncbi:MAG: hypothetical protein COB53_05175, partial [Elusimicrobia bacterium]